MVSPFLIIRLWRRFSSTSSKSLESCGAPEWIKIATGSADSCSMTMVALNPI